MLTHVTLISVGISKQLNATAYLRGVHQLFQQPWEETVPVNKQFCVCASLVPKPMAVVIGLEQGSRFKVHR